MKKFTQNGTIISKTSGFHSITSHLYFHFSLSKKRDTLKKRAAKASSGAIPYYAKGAVNRQPGLRAEDS